MLRTSAQELSGNWSVICCGVGLMTTGIIALARHLAHRRNTKNLGGGIIAERYPGNKGTAGAIKFTEGGAGAQVVRGLSEDEVKGIFSSAPKKKGKAKKS